MDHQSSLENSLNQIAQTTKSPKPEEEDADIDIDVDNLVAEHSRALDQIEDLTNERDSLKRNLEAALQESRILRINSYSKSVSNPEIPDPQSTSEKKRLELEKDNRELKDLLNLSKAKLSKLQNDNQNMAGKTRENESLKLENKRLNNELSELNEELVNMKSQLSDLETHILSNINSPTSSMMAQSPLNQKGVDKSTLLKYTTYIYQLIGALDKGHFASCCFEERFSKDVNLNQLVYSDDQSTVLLQAFKYITDLLMNISTIQHMNTTTPPDSGLTNKSGGNIRSFLEKSQRQFNELFEIEDENEQIINQRIENKVAERLNKSKPEEHFASQFSSKKNSESEFSLGEKGDRLRELNSLKSSLKNSPQLGAGRKHDLDNYISVSELEATGHQALLKQSKDTDSAYESPKFSKYGPVHHTEPNERSKDRDEILEIDEDLGINTGKAGRLARQDLMGRFKQLRARCKELKEQETIEPQNQKKKKTQSEIDLDAKERQNSPSKMTQSNSATHLKSLLSKENSVVAKKVQPSHGHAHSASTIKSKDHTLTASRFDISTLKAAEEDLGRSQISDFDEFQTRSPFKSPTSSVEKSQGRMYSTNATTTFKVYPSRKSPNEKMTYQQMSEAKKKLKEQEEYGRVSRMTKHNHQEPFSSGGHEYNSFKVAFGRTASKSRVNTSPSNYVPIATIDIPKKKKINQYPAQSYDVIKGEELLQKKYYNQRGIMESRAIDRSKNY